MYLTLWIVALRGVERGREEGFVCVCVCVISPLMIRNASLRLA